MSDIEPIIKRIDTIAAKTATIQAENEAMKFVLKSIAHGDYTGWEAREQAINALAAIQIEADREEAKAS